jgi:hypothetical protein
MRPLPTQSLTPINADLGGGGVARARLMDRVDLGQGTQLGVAVIMPLYNKRAHVARAIASVLRQSLADFRLIVVDDGSTDGSSELVAGLRDARLQLLRRTHAGPGAARNAGIAAADCDWIALLDADDEWQPNFLEATLAAARIAEDTVAVYTDVAARGEPGMVRLIGSGAVPDYYGTRMRHGVSMSCSSVLVRRAALIAAGGFNEASHYAEDIETWFRLSCQGPFYFVAEPLCSIEVADAARLTRSVDHLQRAAGLRRLLDTYEAYRRAGRIAPERLAGARRFMQHQRGRIALHLACGGERAAAWRTLLVGVPPGMHTWREYLACAAHTLRRDSKV